MNFKVQRKILSYNLLLLGLLFGLVTLNKEWIRPHFDQNKMVTLFAGSFPNFIAAFLISMAPIIAVIVRKPKHSQLIILISTAVVFIILTFEEIYPLWGASTYYDLYDIIANGLGSVLAFLCFKILYNNKKTEE
jgi:glycopeptide antibiotics resistance protein